MQTEIWKDIPGFEGLYQASTLGRIKSLPRKKKSWGSYKTIIMKQSLNTQGYPFVSLCKEGKVFRARVNRLIAMTFLPNPDNLPQVNHKNEIKTDNRLENLEWISAKDNCNYSVKSIKQYDKNGKFINKWENLDMILKKMKIDKGNIIKVCKGHRKTAGGFIWKYGKSKGGDYVENHS